LTRNAKKRFVAGRKKRMGWQNKTRVLELVGMCCFWWDLINIWWVKLQLNVEFFWSFCWLKIVAYFFLTQNFVYFFLDSKFFSVFLDSKFCLLFFSAPIFHLFFSVRKFSSLFLPGNFLCNKIYFQIKITVSYYLAFLVWKTDSLIF
jgi:hypothetical protein